MDKQLIQIDMPKEVVKKIDGKAASIGIKRSSLIKMFIDQGLKSA